MLRQLALSVSQNNVVGSDGQIAYRFKSDLKSFQWYTASTALITGYRTALELAANKVLLKSTCRELIVIGRPDESLADKFAASVVQFAASLDEAISLAESMAEHERLNGFTIIGGKTIFDELGTEIVWRRARLNSALITTFHHVLEDEKAIKIDPTLIRRIRAEWDVKAEHHFSEFGKVLGRTQSLDYVVNHYAPKSAGFWFDGMRLCIDSTAGIYRIKPFDVMTVREDRQRNTLTLYLGYGGQIDIRLNNDADVSALVHLFTKN